MRDNGIRARHKRRYKATTDSKHSMPVAPTTCWQRNFAPEAPEPRVDGRHHVHRDRRRLAVPGGRAGPVQPRGRRLVDQAADDGGHRDRRADDGVVPAQAGAGVIFHSDRGSQYASHAMRDKLAEYGMTASMSRKGNCWDNAPTESFFNSLKNERVHGTRYATRADAKPICSQYIEVFYNRSRRHSTLGYCSPTQFLHDWISKHDDQQSKAA